MNKNKDLSKRKAIIFEHLPDIKFKNHSGVLLVIYEDGQTFFHPLGDLEKKKDIPSSAELVPIESKKSRQGIYYLLIFILFK